MRADYFEGRLNPGVSGTDALAAMQSMLAGVDVEGALGLIGRVAADSESSHAGYQLALVVRQLLDSSDHKGRAPRELTREGLDYCCGLATSVVASAASSWGVPVPSDAASLMHRVVYQQYPDLEEDGYVPRSLIIYRRIAPALRHEVGFDFEEAFADGYGLSLDEYLRIGMRAYRWCIDGPGKPFSPSDVTPNGYTQGAVERALALLSCDYDAFRSMLDVPDGRNSHFEPYNLNPFRKVPVLKLPGNEYLAPVPSFLLRRITHGLYYDLIDLDRPGYIGLMGRSFKEYVGELLKGQSGLVGGSDGLPWVLHNSDTAVVIETITRPFGALGRSTGDPKHLEQDLSRRGGVVDTAGRLRGFLDSPGELKAAIEGRRIVCVVTALEDFYLANGPMIKGIVEERLENRGTRPDMHSLQLTHVGGLEALQALSIQSGKPIADLMALKVDNVEYNDLELDQFARHMALAYPDGRNTGLTPPLFGGVVEHHLGT
ncbi:MAG: hypothetical protein IIB14_02215 [Chloroflexi bacterium]|nr:hypothetical protein [Chloroflexota bacterium]